MVLIDAEEKRKRRHRRDALGLPSTPQADHNRAEPIKSTIAGCNRTLSVDRFKGRFSWREGGFTRTVVQIPNALSLCEVESPQGYQAGREPFLGWI